MGLGLALGLRLVLLVWKVVIIFIIYKKKDLKAICALITERKSNDGKKKEQMHH